ncbi:phenylalanine--tRNA ligase subunit beta [Stigmatella aurantiaca]|uniref:Phenylalanine--tRNA ligase beta subunit n=2 Tax=Stigmatella aurantiaca (strain DW4/3-1) TaxID=378806 RepID=E3FPA6_STIAD|nr:phenylalanine--tRNA ligase subunit beta [Stigmatella aurantiaca]ADO71916.1 Phenylalanyl-tRNA synthetase, beta subunit [Stigmatella aurantiaca DW4/3-1]
MKISVKWLGDYVALPAVEELARKLTAAGLEIEGMERPGEALQGVVVAQIRESVQHPNADKLSVTQVDAGGPQLLQVVCGAKNFKVGDKVPLATVGTKLPNGVEIKQAALRGVDSHGMLCSSKELGLSEESSGLLILPAGLKPGLPIASALGLDDVVLEVNVTPNRPDALSHLGVAREVGVVTGVAFRPPEPKLSEAGGATADKVKVRIEDPVRCPRYAARVVENVTIQPSPQWLQDRLKACGVRAINNVVDVTNYVNLEYGQPLHAFDLDKVAGQEIVIRCARPGEKIRTLDGKERTLDADDLAICDRDRAQAIAGVMGGADSEVTGGTKRIVLESANFLASSVRRSSKRHGLHTEASHRFERGADLDAVGPAIDRAAQLIAELSGGTVASGRVDVYPGQKPARRVTLRFARVEKVLGTAVPEGECRRILGALGFRGVEDGSAQATFEVPRARVDVEREEDLLEEIARVFGYDNIPARLPRGVAELAPEPPQAEAERRLRQALSGAGLNEVVNYSFVAPRNLEVLGGKDAPVVLVNPLSVEQSVMRTSLLPGLLENLSRSVRHQVERVAIHETGRAYVRDPEGGQGQRPATREVSRVAGLVWGLRSGRTWTQKDARMDFYDAKGAVEAVLHGLRVVGARFEPAEAPAWHPRACAQVLLADGTVLGHVGELHPRVTKALELPQGVFAFELDTEPLYAAAQLAPAYHALPRFPAVLRDLAVVVPVELRNDEVRRVILEVGGTLVEDALIFDVYTGKPIPEGKKNLAYAIRYRSQERTLTDGEVGEAHQRIISEVNQRLGGALRA